MEIWPAIDLRGGKCVRLQQGDYARETVFGDDPAAMAQRWVAAGADRLHLVDLDGARDGVSANADCVRRLRRTVAVPCELGGGVRDEAAIQHWLHVGISRVVVGTRAAREPEWFGQMCDRYPGRLVLGLDARDGLVATDGWQHDNGVAATEFVRRFAQAPLAAVVYTDIAQDGMLTGPNLRAIEELQQATTLPIIASGGVTTAADVLALTRLGVAGCIIGRALYEGRLTIEEALRAAAR